MSKIGKQPIKFDPAKISIIVEKGGLYNNQIVKVKGPKGELTEDIRPSIDVQVNNDEVLVTRSSEAKTVKSFHGLYRSIIANMVVGVMTGYEKRLEIQGVGYRGAQKGNVIELSLGFSHMVKYTAPDGITITMPDETNIIINGFDKQKVGQVAAEIRQLRKPEPYKGKGIRYLGENVRRKAGKSAAA
ncbi:MAG: 50S ribosomal protein L6 [bacterium]